MTMHGAPVFGPFFLPLVLKGRLKQLLLRIFITCQENRLEAETIYP